MRHHRTPIPSLHNRGTSLIEVLVALLVMTLGLLAMISLHTAAVRYHKMAEFRSVATQLAEDYGDRMRANLTGARNGNYVRQVAWSQTPDKPADPGISCTAACSADALAAQVAASDISQWLNNAASMLPGIGLFAQRPDGANANSMTMDVWITWQDPGDNADDAAANALINAGYSCPPGLGTVPPEVRCLRYRFTL
jgi:type IV pilus assembly protein PilV